MMIKMNAVHHPIVKEVKYFDLHPSDVLKRVLSSLKEGAPCQGSDKVARAIAAKTREGCTSSGKRISLAAKDAIAHLNVR